MIIMSIMNEENREELERRRKHQNSILQYMINDIEIRNEGCIDPIKYSNNIRIMSLNIKGLDL